MTSGAKPKILAVAGASPQIIQAFGRVAPLEAPFTAFSHHQIMEFVPGVHSAVIVSGNLLVPFTDASYLESDPDTCLFIDGDYALRMFKAAPTGNSLVTTLKRDYGVGWLNFKSRLRFKYNHVGRVAGFSGPFFAGGFSPIDESPQLLGSNPKIYFTVTIFNSGNSTDSISVQLNNWDGVSTFNGAFVGFFASQYPQPGTPIWVEAIFDPSVPDMTLTLYSDAFVTSIGTDTQPLSGAFSYRYFFPFDAAGVAQLYVNGMNGEDFRITEWELIAL